MKIKIILISLLMFISLGVAGRKIPKEGTVWEDKLRPGVRCLVANIYYLQIPHDDEDSLLVRFEWRGNVYDTLHESVWLLDEFILQYKEVK